MSPATAVLLVEDDPDLRGALGLVLRARGLSVEEAADAASALDRLSDADAPFDAVVTDLGLPDLEGAALLVRLREAAPGARLVVLTGRSGADLRRTCLRAGADEVLAKPVSGDRLADALVP